MTHAGLWLRLLAHNIDLALLLPCFYLLSLVIPSNMLLYGVCLFIGVSYEVILVSIKGGTVGKRMLKLKVTTSNYQSLTMTHSLARSLTKLVSCGFFFVGFAIIELNRQKKRIS